MGTRCFESSVFTTFTHYSPTNSNKLLWKQKSWYSTKLQDSKEKKTPVALYSTLKIYGTFRSNCHQPLFQYWTVFIVWSYSWLHKKTFRCPDWKLWTYWVFLLNPLWKLIFMVVAKDNIDFNTTLSTAVKHFHGTNMTVMQFPVS